MRTNLLRFFSMAVLTIVASMQAWATPPMACEATFEQVYCFHELSINGEAAFDTHDEFAEYRDFTNKVISTEENPKVTFIADDFMWEGLSTTGWKAGVAIFADFNMDGDFEEENELLWRSEDRELYHEGEFIVPEDVDGGDYRLRFVASGRNITNLVFETGCGSNDRGQVIDFTLRVAEKTPRITNLFPQKPESGVSVFSRGHEIGTPWVEVTRVEGMPDVTLDYKIIGPLPLENVIYQATQEGNIDNPAIMPNPQPEGKKVKYTFTHAKGLAAKYDLNNPNNIGNTADPDNEGIFDLQTNQLDIAGGVYRAVSNISFEYEGQQVSETTYRDFIIAIDNDLAITDARRPLTIPKNKYGTGVSVPLSATITNVGYNEVSHFVVTAKVFTENGTAPLHTSQKEWKNVNTPLETADYTVIEFDPYKAIDGIGNFRVEYSVELKSAFDESADNNIYPAPSTNKKHIFEIAYRNDAEPIAVLSPAGSENYVGRPIVPRIHIQNNGIVDLTDVPVKMQIKDPSGNVVYDEDIIVEVVPQGLYNKMKVYLPKDFIPEVAGLHTVKFVSLLPIDDDKSNDIIESNFNVINSLSGTYTIGLANQNGTRNFNTIDEAIDMLYKSGVYGPVVFELTDAEYNVGSLNSNGPAVDLSSKIIGVSEVNTITFKPSDARSTTKASINFNLKSGNGIGFYIAQNDNHSNSKAVVNIVNSTKKRLFANTEGNIIFDGGNQKSFKFNLETKNDQFASVFYLGAGARNCQIKNSIFIDETPNFKSSLPLTVYNAGAGAFIQEANQRSNNAYYTAAIVLRSVAPKFPETNSNFFNLDTLTADNNVIANNEISGYGYGIASMGTGLLFQAGNVNEFTKYYNSNNVYEANKIYNVGHAGIFVGFENGSEIRHNRIYDVKGTETVAACGIAAGGEAERDMFGYNTVDLKILGNEISHLTNKNEIYGVKVDQSPSIVIENNKFSYFPKAEDNVLIANNSIWQLEAQETYTTRVGVAVFSQRATKGNFQTASIVPAHNDYVVRNTNVVNNTILVNGDDGVENTAAVIGIALQDNRNAVIKNNAVAVMDNDFAENCLASTALYLQSGDVNNQNVVSDRNAFWTNNSASTVARMVETNENNEIIEMGYTTEYNTLNNWMVWSGQDMNSIEANFMEDYEFTGATPQQLRVKSNPLPLNSVLNNRGDRIESNTSDLVGNARGEAGQRYDIGALEFNGRTYVSDVESTTMLEPAAFKANDGTEFGDAEYIMTSLPLSVKVRVRNNGSLVQHGTKAHLAIYRELPNGEFASAPEYTQEVAFDATTFESTDVEFDLEGKFVPKTYSDLRLNPAYVAAVPAKFAYMTSNVTPRYRLEVKVENDEDNYNNVVSKNVRYFIRRSWLRLLVSSEYINAELNANSNTEVIASALNHDKLIEGLNAVGWDIDIDPNATDVEADRFDFDVLDRNSWEPRAIDYTHHNTVIWSDAHDVRYVGGEEVDNKLTRFQEMDLDRFIDAGTINVKKNLIFASQELLRNQTTDFATSVFGALNRPVATPDVIDYTNVTGMNIGRNLVHFINSTNFGGDVDPQPALMNMTQEIEGVAKLGFYYTDVVSGNQAIPETEKIHTIGTVSPKANRILLGSDWRHFVDIEKVLRALLDFTESNGGAIVPVELVNFDANSVDNRVVLNWATASELNSDRFEIERTTANNGFDGLFERIETVDAAGKSGQIIDYNAVDYAVEFGNTYAYRLKMIDRDGKFEYSETEYVTLEGANSLAIKAVTPNPVVTDANVTVSVYESANVEIYLVDMSGKLVANVFEGNLSAGTHTIKLDAANIASGNYTIVLNSNNIVRTATVKVAK